MRRELEKPVYPSFMRTFQPLLHVPLTQSKRKDPTHVPYYLINFETILRGVIDETDDVRLFDEDDLKIVQTFRDLDLV